MLNVHLLTGANALSLEVPRDTPERFSSGDSVRGADAAGHFFARDDSSLMEKKEKGGETCRDSRCVR